MVGWSDNYAIIYANFVAGMALKKGLFVEDQVKYTSIGVEVVATDSILCSEPICIVGHSIRMNDVHYCSIT